MHAKILTATLAAAAMGLAIPAMASATAVPNLPLSADQAYIADSGGFPENGTVTVTGTISMNGAVTLGCQISATIDYFDDGTTAVTAFTATPCMVYGAAFTSNCALVVNPTSLDWGDRFGYDTDDSTFRDYINVSLDTIITDGPTPPCPIKGTFGKTGILSPTLSVSGNVLSMTFGSGSGNLTGPTGSETWSGTLSGTLPSGSNLVY